MTGASYYARTVSKVGGCPVELITNLGTENGLATALQSFCRDNPEAYRCVASPRNQRIEGWWSYYSKSKSFVVLEFGIFWCRMRCAFILTLITTFRCIVVVFTDSVVIFANFFMVSLKSEKFTCPRQKRNLLPIFIK